MKFLTVILLAWLVAYVNAFALYGGYERMAFYYAYLIERSLKGTDASKIANGCTKNDKDCSFKDFIKWINKDGDKIPQSALDALPNDRLPDIDKTAQLLDDNKLCGEYVFDKVYKGSTSPANLFKNVALFVNGNIAAIDAKEPALLKGVQTGYDRVKFLRVGAASDKMIEALKAANIADIRTTPKEITPGGESRGNLNVGATITANPNADIKGIVRKTYDDSHKANVEAVDEAVGLVCNR